jgi:regulator of protease activity HflC (stomatin/prohibitin superfamily)
VFHRKVLEGLEMNITIVISLIAGLAWIVTVGMLAVTVVRASRRQSTKGTITAFVLAALVALILTTVSKGLVFVDPKERGVVISAFAPKGYREQPLTPGLRWIVPYVESVEYYSIAKETYTMSIAAAEGQIAGDDSVSARTSDGQEIFIDASVLFSVDPTKVIDVHINWQKRYRDDLVRPLSRGVIRDAVSQFRVDEVYSTRRGEMSQWMEESMAEALSDNGLLLSDFVLRNITFSPEYAASVEQKQVAEQQAQQAKFVVEQRRQEAEQARQTAQGAADAAVIASEGEAKAIVIQANADAEARLIQANAEAEALELLAAAINRNPDVLTLEYIQKLAPGIQVMLVPNDNPFLLPLPSLDGSSSVETPVSVLPTPTAPFTETTP